MSDFLIGLEFEFGWLPKLVRTHGSNFTKKIKKAIYFDSLVKEDVSQYLKDSLGDLYYYIDEIKEDPTLKFDDKYYKTFYGVEVVSKPMPEKIALNFIRKMFEILNNNYLFKVNKTCSLHVNMSFERTEKTNNIDYLSLLSKVPQEEILKDFKRCNNKYCESSKVKKFSIPIDDFKTVERTFDFWSVFLNKKNDSILKLTKDVFLKKNKNYKNIVVNYENKQKILNNLENFFCERLKEAGKNLSIVDKKNEAGIRYFEFRMIGNSFYHKNFEKIEKIINIYKESMNMSINNG